MELFPVFLFGMIAAFVGAAVLTVYIAFKTIELP